MSLRALNIIVYMYLQPFEGVYNICTYNIGTLYMEGIYNICTYNIDTYNHRRCLSYRLPGSWAHRLYSYASTL